MTEIDMELQQLRRENEQLKSDLRLCRNELCLKCGRFGKAYMGACNGCRWKETGNADAFVSVQRNRWT